MSITINDWLSKSRRHVSQPTAECLALRTAEVTGVEDAAGDRLFDELMSRDIASVAGLPCESRQAFNERMDAHAEREGANADLERECTTDYGSK